MDEPVKDEMPEREDVPVTIDLDNLPKQDHHWVDRGMKVTCETPAHPYHEAWKRRPLTKT